MVKTLKESDSPPRVKTCTAFAGSKRLAYGAPAEVAVSVKAALRDNPKDSVLVFDDLTSEPVEFDLRGTEAQIRRRHEPTLEAEVEETETEPEARKPGRPKLGVVAREVTLLPRHWDWLNDQPGGASVALRKLVEAARRDREELDRIRRAREAAYRFMTAMAGNEPGYEEALRAMYAGERVRFNQLIARWPGDIRAHVSRLVDAIIP